MGKGKRAETGTPFYLTVWQFIKRHKKICIPAAAGFVILLTAVILILSLNSGGDEPPVEPEPSPSPSPVLESPVPPSPSEEEPSPDEPVLFANPLTGLSMENDLLLENRPIAVMHNNSYDTKGRQNALPMFGISRADVIYEVMAEGGITRMLALYQDISNIPKIGAVRSTRRYYVELALAYDAVLIHAGGSPQAYSDIPTWGADTIDGTKGYAGKWFWRDKDRLNSGVASEHTMFTSAEFIQESLSRFDRLTVSEDFDNGLHFTGEDTPSGGEATRIKAPFSTSKPTWFQYNEEDSLYYVEEYGSAYIDGETGEQIAVTNVIILQTSINLIPGDTAGRLAVDLTSGGKGYYAAGGQYVPIIWSRESQTSPFIYTLEDGSPLELLSGKSYICIIAKELTPEFS